MRVLHVVHQYPPDHVGGTELYTRAMVERQAVTGHVVVVFCPEPGPESGRPADENGVRVYRAGAGRRGRTVVFLSALGGGGKLVEAFDRVLAAERPDVVHVQHQMGLPPAIAGRLRAAGIPYVLTLHDYWYGCANAQLLTNDDATLCAGPDARFVNCGRCALARAGVSGLAPAAPLVAPMMARRNRLLRPVFDGAAEVLAATPFVRDAYRGMGFPVEQIRLLPLGVDVSAGEQAAAAEARARRPVGDLFRIGYVGGIAPQKGIHHLIAAVNRLPERATLAIYGDETALPDYTAELRRAATHPGIRFMGPLARAALWPALGELDVFVAPTLWYETYALAAREALAAGVPVVASRIGVMADAVRDEVDGRLFPPGDVDALHAILLELMEGPDEVGRLRAGVSPMMTMDEHAGRLEAIYQAVMGMGPT